ncbi:unnamed protein product [Onchocerca flexuosa]|uniref:RGS domain-containing protein n=1 Tax=Onchocerca flexuosa TaxID=387005 RepID=A0A183HTJ5_9BILA|nr:unnamed protein product [Onchocerca flexuosa]
MIVFAIITVTVLLVAEREKGEKSRLTSVERVRVRLRTTAYELLKYYVYFQGINTSEVLTHSIESRDWLSCAEPTAVRSAMKHFISDLAAIDSAIKPFVSFLQMQIFHCGVKNY